MVGTRLLVLIPESTRKAKGGDPIDPKASGVVDELPREARARLESLRGEMASAAAATIKDPAAFLPAYRRFQGNMYRRIEQESWEKRHEGVEVFIVSGLYGLLASREPAVAYGCSMAETLEPLGKLNRWWHDHGLPGILAEAVKKTRPRQVIDLLSLEYREAVTGYAAQAPGIPARTIDFRGLGRGSQPRRGKMVDEILRTGRLPAKKPEDD